MFIELVLAIPYEDFTASWNASLALVSESGFSTRYAIVRQYMKTISTNEDIKYTYKLQRGISSIRGGTKVLNDLEYPKEILLGAETVIDELAI